VAKTSGLTTAVTIASNVISNDVTSINLDTPYGVQDITGLDKSAIERLLLRADATGSLTGVFNTASSMSHATLKTPGSKTFVIAFAAARPRRRSRPSRRTTRWRWAPTDR
jgi:hypothetical protein